MQSIRQDLTVQHVRSSLTVSVYETHARVALEVGDLAEYTQCSSNLQRLYLEGLPGCEGEFTAYRILAAAVLGPQAMSLELLSLSARCQALRSQSQVSGRPVAAAILCRARCELQLECLWPLFLPASIHPSVCPWLSL